MTTTACETLAGDWAKTAAQRRIGRLHRTKRARAPALEWAQGRGALACVCRGELRVTSSANCTCTSASPGFGKPAARLAEDTARSIPRGEMRCLRCEPRFGHLFAEGPRKSRGLWYRIDSPGLPFEPGGT